MAKIHIRYFTTRRRLNGPDRNYWQPSTDLQKAGWKVQRLPDDEKAAMTEAERLNADLDRWRGSTDAAPTNAKAGSIEALINSYKNSWRFKELAPKTRGGYEYCFRIIRSWAGDSPVTAITPRLVQKFYLSKREQYPAKAAAVIRVLRLLLEYARREDMISLNPAAKPGIKNVTRKGLLWTPEAVAFFVSQADEQGYFSIGTAVHLNQWLGQRKGDIISMPITAYKDGKLFKKQNKTGAEVALPIDDVPELKARLDLQIERNKKEKVPSTVLFAGVDGQPYSEYWFTHLFARIRDKGAEKLIEENDGKELKEGHPLFGFGNLVFKDLRHTAVTRLAEAGCPIPMIASITGHSFRTCEEIVDRYNIRTSKMAEQAFRLRLAAESQP